MNRYFPDYGGGNDAVQASKYIIERFHRLNGNNHSLFPRLCEASGTWVVIFYMSCCLKSNLSVRSNANSKILKHIDTSNLQIVFKAVQDTIIFNNMSDVFFRNTLDPDAHLALKPYGRRDKGKEDRVRGEWKEHGEDNASRQDPENGDAGKDVNETESGREVTPSEIGVAL